MAGLASSAYETNSNTRTAVNQLAELLDALFPDPDLNIFTLGDFRNRYRLTGLGHLAMQAIEQSQRINRQINDFARMGLCEFHIGLIYLFCGDNHGAMQQFRLARRQWSFVSRPKYTVCLAYFAEGAAQELAHHYEEALSCYGRVRQCLEQKKSDRFGFQMAGHPASAARTMHSYVQQRSRVVREILWAAVQQTWQPQPCPEEYAPRFIWYQVQSEEPSLFPQIRRGMWLLVNQITDQHKFNSGELVVLTSERPVAEAVILQAVNGASPFPRIYLARSEITGTFVRDAAGQVSFTARKKDISVDAGNILGIVVGFWRTVHAPL